MGNDSAYDEEMLKLADEYYEEGKQTFFKNRLEESALLVQNAIHLYKQCEDYVKYTAALNLMGVVYATTGNETMAIDYYMEGLECAIDHGCNNILVLFYDNIGSRYHELGEYEKAIDYFIKAVQALGNPECMKEERHDNWCLVTYINLTASYRYMGNYDLAEKYLKMAECYMTGENEKIYHYSFLILKCQLWWSTGKSAYVYAHMEELLESGTKNINASDYAVDMRDLCCLFKEMKEYDNWKRIICDFEKYVDSQNSVYLRLTLTEMWMDYYKAIKDNEAYVRLCVEYIELHQKQEKIANKERAAAIDIKIQLREKEVERRRAEALSTTDALTGLGNRYLISQDVDAMAKEAAAKQQKMTIGVLDIDCFKQENDTYGHIKGDGCIQTVAAILRDAVGDSGKAYRFGGDEFVILLPGGERKLIEQIAGKIQSGLKDAGIANINSTVIPEVTISQGYACFVPQKGEEKDRLIEHADHALYYVKKHGRNAYYIIEE